MIGLKKKIIFEHKEYYCEKLVRKVKTKCAKQVFLVVTKTAPTTAARALSGTEDGAMMMRSTAPPHDGSSTPVSCIVT